MTSTKEKHANMFMSIIINCLESLLSKDLFIKIRTRTVVKLPLFWFDFF